MEFALFRYDFERVHHGATDNLFPTAVTDLTPDEAFEQKQDILQDILLSDYDNSRPLRFETPRNRTPIHHVHMMKPAIEGIAILRLDTMKTVSHHPKPGNNAVERVPDWRSCYIVIDNRAGVQHIAIEVKKKAFSNPDTVARMIESALTPELRPVHLRIHLSRRGDARDFWSVIGDRLSYPYGFDRLHIILPHPNSQILKDNLKKFLQRYRDTMHSNMKLTFEAEEGASLNIDPSDDELRTLIDVCINYVGADCVKARPFGSNHNVIIAKNSKRMLDIPRETIENISDGDLFNPQAGLYNIEKILNAAEK